MGEKRLRVLQIVSGFDLGGANGGAERFGIELSRHLNRRQIEVSVCAFRKHGGSPEQHWHEVLQDEGIDVFFAADWVGKLDIPKYLYGVRRIAKHCTPPVDIIHSHSPLGTPAAILLKAFGQTRFAMRTAHVTQEGGEGIAAWVYRQTFLPWFYPISLDAEVGVAQSIADILRRHPGARLVGGRYELIHNAINTDTKHNSASSASTLLPTDNKELIVGSVGRLSREKGYTSLIEALPHILSELPATRLVLVGDGALRDLLSQRARDLGVQDRILFAGQREDVIPLIRKMDLFVSPSLAEGFSTVLLESMACGIPVVATDIAGTRELLRDGITAWLVPPQDSEKLASAIVQALKNPSRRAEIARRAQEVVKEFSIERVARQYESLYRNLLREQGVNAD